jgi:hypothetical protein
MAGLCLLSAEASRAAPPDLSFQPAPDADGVFDGDGATPTFEITLPPSSVLLHATPTGGSGPVDCQLDGSCTRLECRIDVVSGDQSAAVSSNSVAFIGGGSSEVRDVEIDCPRLGQPAGVLDSHAQLTCTLCKGITLQLDKSAICAQTVTRVWDVLCSASSKPEFASVPGAGQPIVLSANVGGSASSIVTVSNSGNAALEVTPQGLSGVLSILPLGKTTIAPGASADLTVSCAPTAFGDVTQSLGLATNDADEASNSYPVSCHGRAANAAVAPASGTPINLQTTIGSSASATITVANSGDATLTLAAAAPPLGSPFALLPNGSSVAPGASRDLTVSCIGNAVGTVNATLSFGTNAPDLPSVSYPLSCQTVAGAEPVFGSTPAPGGTIDLATTVGAVTQAGLQLGNSGVGTLSISASVGQGAPAGLLSVTPSASVGAGQVGALTVTCNGAGQLAGHYSSTLALSSNDPQRPSAAYTVNCDLAAVAAPEYASVPSAGTLSLVAEQGQAASVPLVVSNIGNASLTISSISLPAGPKISLSSAQGLATPIVIAPGASRTFSVACATSSTGSFSDAFSFSTNDADEGTVNYPVSCTVSASHAEFASQPAAPGNFLLRTVKGTDATAGLTVSNLGSATLTVAVLGAVAPLSVTSTPACTAGSPCSVPANGGTLALSVRCSAANTGTFDRTFVLSTNDSDEGSVNYSVRCLIDPPPAVYASTPAPGAVIPIGGTAGGTAGSTLQVSNAGVTGAAALHIDASGLVAPLSVAPTTADIAAGASRNLAISCASTSPGSFSQILSLASSDPARPVATYTVNCTMAAPPGPEFDALPAANTIIPIAAVAGLRSYSNIRIYNRGSSSLTVAAVQGGGPAITATAPGSPIAAGGFTDMQVSCGGNQRGQFLGTLTLTTNDVDEGTVNYYVSCTVSSSVPVDKRLRTVLLGSAFANGVVNDRMFSDGFE